MAERYEPSLGRPILGGTEEEIQEAMKASQEAWRKSEEAYERYMEAFDHWQDIGCPVDGQSVVEAAWVKYADEYNAYITIHRESAGKYGTYSKPPYQQQHA